MFDFTNFQALASLIFTATWYSVLSSFPFIRFSAVPPVQHVCRLAVYTMSGLLFYYSAFPLCPKWAISRFNALTDATAALSYLLPRVTCSYLLISLPIRAINAPSAIHRRSHQFRYSERRTAVFDVYFSVPHGFLQE